MRTGKEEMERDFFIPQMTDFGDKQIRSSIISPLISDFGNFTLLVR
jgi:hypothetical protein